MVFYFHPRRAYHSERVAAGHGAWHVTEVVERGCWWVSLPRMWCGSCEFSFIRVHLGGGNSNICIFTPILGERIRFD